MTQVLWVHAEGTLLETMGDRCCSSSSFSETVLFMGWCGGSHVRVDIGRDGPLHGVVWWQSCVCGHWQGQSSSWGGVVTVMCVDIGRARADNPLHGVVWCVRLDISRTRAEVDWTSRISRTFNL